MQSPTLEPSRAGRRERWAVAVALTLLAFGALVGTSRDYAMVWDEGHSVRREMVLVRWFAGLADGFDGIRHGFEPAALEVGWPFARKEPDGHPSFYALLGVAGWSVSPSGTDPLLAYRLGPMALAALTVGIVYFHMSGRRGRLAGATAASALILIPQLFSMAHYAHYDMPLSCLWLLTQVGFLNALRARRWIVPFGVAFGLAAGTKFTGMFAILPALTWVLWSEWVARIRIYPPVRGSDRKPLGRPGTRAVLLGLLVAAATLYAIHPPWWSNPVGGFRRFVESNLTRSSTIPIPSYYLGGFYRFGLPWHNTIVYTLVSVPPGILLLGLVGIGSAVAGRRDDPEGSLWVLSWLTLMVVRALPFVPGHDGIRLILPSVASLAVLSGIGAASLRDRWAKSGRGWVAALLATLALAGSALGIARLYPYTLSYYSEAIGGLRGARFLGFDQTYYWDTMGREFAAWVETERRRRPLAIRFPSNLVNIPYLRRWEKLPSDLPIFGFDPEADTGDYVVQMRRSMFYPYDHWLDRHGHPLFVIRREGVDLLRVYSYEESVRAVRATFHLPTPMHLAP